MNVMFQYTYVIVVVFLIASGTDAAAAIRVRRADDLVGSVEAVVQQLTQQVSTLTAEVDALKAKTGR
jgi:outer membrane murein-binding lipoprotein Lpp